MLYSRNIKSSVDCFPEHLYSEVFFKDGNYGHIQYSFGD